MMRALTLPALTTLLLLAACGGEPEPPAAPPATYQVRGLVRQLPDPEHPSRALMIHHEAIPDFKDERGEMVGMGAMTMPFPVVDPALLEGLATGDKVAFELEVAWNETPPVRVTRIDKLPPETELDFSKKPAASEGTAQDPDGS